MQKAPYLRAPFAVQRRALACTYLSRSLATKYVYSPPRKPMTMFSYAYEGSMNLEKPYC